jgi:hypothetical protein
MPDAILTGGVSAGRAHCRSLGYARDDKGRYITQLILGDSDGSKEFPPNERAVKEYVLGEYVFGG